MNTVILATSPAADLTAAPLAVTASMTAAELLAATRELRAMIGPAAEITAMVMPRHTELSATLGVYPDGLCKPNGKHFDGHDWPEVFALARYWIVDTERSRRNDIVRRMALTIIDLTDAWGGATEHRLEKIFTTAEVAEYHEQACRRASLMAGNRPYQVTFE
jgi:hypothetical protein